MSSYDTGDLVRLTARFTDSSDAAVDPSTVTFKARNDTTTVTYVYGTDPEVVKEATGVYHVDFDITVDGPWYFRVSSTGTGQAAGETVVFARQPVIS